MEDEKRIIHCFDDFMMEENLLSVLQDKQPSLRFVARDIVEDTRELAEAILSPNMAEYIGVEQIGDSDDVLWSPSPLDQNWFKRLSEEGHTGKRIVLTTTSDARNGFGPFATTDAIELTGENIAKRILEALTN